MKKAFKWIGIVLLCPILLLLFLAALLYVPPIQNWVAQRVVAYASETTGMEITVGHVDLSFPLDLGVDDVRIIHDGDTIADIRRAVVDVQLWPLLKDRVVIDELELHDAKVNTTDFIGDLRLQGNVGRLSLKSPGIFPTSMEMMLASPSLSDAYLRVYMSDTAAVDTSSGGWRVRFDRFKIERSRIAVIMDSAALFTDSATHIDTYMGRAFIDDADIDLGLGRFAFGGIDWKDGRLSYDRLFAMSEVNIGIDSLLSHGDVLSTSITHASLREDSTGLMVEHLKGHFSMDGDRFRLSSLTARTPTSSISADADVSLASLTLAADSSSADNHLNVDAQLGSADIRLFAPDLPEHLLPDLPLALRADVSGNAALISVEELNVTLPSVFQAEASGTLRNVTDVDGLLSQLDVRAEAFNLDPLLRHFDLLPPDYRIPKGLKLSGNVKSRGEQYTIDMTAREGTGTVAVKGYADLKSNSYDLQSEIRQLNLRHFMPRDSLGLLSADVSLNGRGFDPFDTASDIAADIRVHKLEYGSWKLDSLQAMGNISGGHATFTAKGAGAHLAGLLDVDAQLASKSVKATVKTQLSHIDLQALGLAQAPTTIGFSGNVDLQSDLQLSHRLSAQLHNIYIRDSIATHRPEAMSIQAYTGTDTTSLHLKSGDLSMKLDAGGSYEQLGNRLLVLADTIASQREKRTIDQQKLKQLLPTATLSLTSKRNNPLADILRASTGVDFKDLTAHLTTSPSDGLNGSLRLQSLTIDGTPIDTIRFTLVDKKDHGQTFNGQITNNRRNPLATFNILFDGQLQEHGARFGVRYFDEQGRQNIRIGAKAEMVSDGLRFQLIPSRPTLGYKEFTLNDDNFLWLHDNMKLEANADLKADDGTSIKIYSEEQDSTLLQDLTISASHLDLGELTQGVAMLPKITGRLTGDYHLMMDQQHNISVASDMHVDQLAYEGSPIGNLGSEFVYLLREDGTHVVDAALMLDDDPIGTLQGSYFSGKRLDATLDLTSMPLSIVNGFMPDQLFGFEGTADGTLSVKGPLADLKSDGVLRFSDGYLVSNPYGMRMRFGNTPVKIEQSKLLFDDFALYAYNDNPLNITGSVDLNAAGDSAVSLRLSARNFQLINARQKKESVAYGRMFVNFFARLNGNLDQLNMRGRLDVLGNTDLNYILLDSPLSTDNQMDELVQFTDFSDTIPTVVERPETDALRMDMQLSIDQGAHVRCALNADQSNYIDLLGGGDLRMRMNADGLSLNGRYTISSGTMKYSLPVIPLKTFTLHEGSYVEFTGQPDNPTLNITATERTRASVTTDDGQSRNVNFDCGVIITQTLANMGLQFTIAAPEDMQLQGDLASMGVEQRGKLAVTMLTTGMYLADGNTNAFSMNSALSSFLQNEINNITSNALKTVDLQLGLDNVTDASGQMRTDYSFKFAKRFWNNRLNVQIGGKVSTGAELEGQNQSFFDNVTMEYRLSPTSNQYVKLFYKQNVYDWLEGYTGEYGGGFVWKRKLNSLLDIFRATPPTAMPGAPRPAAAAVPPAQESATPTIQQPSNESNQDNQ